jgi:hypothetical protein
MSQHRFIEASRREPAPCDDWPCDSPTRSDVAGERARALVRRDRHERAARRAHRVVEMLHAGNLAEARRAGRDALGDRDASSMFIAYGLYADVQATLEQVDRVCR